MGNWPRIRVTGSASFLAACASPVASVQTAADALLSWNEGPSKQAILEFVATEIPTNEFALFVALVLVPLQEAVFLSEDELQHRLAHQGRGRAKAA
jgi:hypothetical protein